MTLQGTGPLALREIGFVRPGEPRDELRELRSEDTGGLPGCSIFID